MKRKMKTLQAITVLVAVVGCGMPFFSPSGIGVRSLYAAPMEQQGGMPAQKVGVIALKKTAVPHIVTLPGRAVAYEQVDIRPRVDGVISKILYTPGQKLDVGTPLFQLDDASYVADVASAEAAAASAKAKLPLAQAAYDRAVKLKGSGYTEAEVESAKSDLAEAIATLKADEAALTYAKIELSWTTVTSPIQGYAEVADVSVGDLVTNAQSDALTTVTRLDPIEVDMLEPSAKILAMREQIEKGLMQPSAKLKASLYLENGTTYKGVGTLVTPSKIVSTTTGAVSMRFRFENSEQKILPGMFLRGSIELGTIEAFLIPQRAASMGSDGKLTAYVVQDGKAKEITLESDGTYQNSWIVSKGVSEGSQLIVDTLKNMRAGISVVPVLAKIDENGIVQDIAPAAASSAAAASHDVVAGTEE